MTFEQTFERLDDVVKKLESGDLPLEESLALYEEGMKLAAQCNDWLDQAELRVRQLTSVGGELQTSDFTTWEERDA